jgi:hypothetical protein
MAKPEDILTKDDLTRERTVTELRTWVEQKSDEFGATKEGTEYARLGKGLAKEFFEEVRPVALFAHHEHGSSDSVTCKPVLGNQNFDAVVREPMPNGMTERKLEVTRAIDGYDEHLRIKYLNEHGYASKVGKMTVSGSKLRGHNIKLNRITESRQTVVQGNLELILKAARGKTGKEYGSSHSLVIAFDDYRVFRNAEDLEVLKAFVEQEFSGMDLDFEAVYLVGESGRTCIEFIPAGEKSNRVRGRF